MTKKTQIKVGPGTFPIMITLDHYMGSPVVDIRRYYLDKKSNNLSPTRKGITLKEGNFKALLDALQNGRTEILEWLSHDDDRTFVQAAETLAKRSAAKEESSRQPHHIDTQQSDWRSPKFFEILSRGSTDVLRYNKNHPFVTALESINKNNSGTDVTEQFTHLLNKLLVAYHHAKSLLDTAEEISASTLLEALEYEWGMLLMRYAEK